MFNLSFDAWYNEAEEVHKLEDNRQILVPFILGYATLCNINVDILFPLVNGSVKCMRVTPYPISQSKFKANYSLKLTWDPKDNFCVVQKRNGRRSVRFSDTASSCCYYICEKPNALFNNKNNVIVTNISKTSKSWQFQKKMGCMDKGVATLPAEITLRENKNGNTANNDCKLNTSCDLRTYLEPGDGVFIYSSTQLTISTIAKVLDTALITEHPANLRFETIPFKIKKIDRKLFRYYQSMKHEERKAMHVKFVSADRKTQAENAITVV